MKNRKYGYSEEVTLVQLDRRATGLEYQALCLLSTRLSHEFCDVKIGEHIALVSSAGDLELYVCYYPAHHPVGFQARIRKAADRYWAELQRYLPAKRGAR